MVAIMMPNIKDSKILRITIFIGSLEMSLSDPIYRILLGFPTQFCEKESVF